MGFLYYNEVDKASKKYYPDWNGARPKFDLRDWAPNHEKMGKGVTLSNEEFEALKELLNKI